jgi:hypothetical protein
MTFSRSVRKWHDLVKVELEWLCSLVDDMTDEMLETY